MTIVAIRPLVEILSRDGKRGIRWNFHSGQRRAMQSRKRFVTVLAGYQSGKTESGPPWLLDEVRQRGPGDYLVVTPTFQLLMKKALPAFLRIFGNRGLRLGEYHAQSKIFEFSDHGAAQMWPGQRIEEPTQIFFGHAQDPESLESATAKAAWLDEAGQRKFRLGSWEAIQRRLAIHQGRALITTTPYDLGWLKQRLWDPWVASCRNHPEIDVIRFDSTTNPAFPKEEFDRICRDWPRWKVDLFARAIFTRPAGLIYDAFNEDLCKVPRFAIPGEWARFLGLDFGGVNTAGVFFAEELDSDGKKTGRYFAYREYGPVGERSAAEHCHHLLKDEPRRPTCVGGSHSEGQWRREFAAAGLPVREPNIKEVEVGIDRVYAAHKKNEIMVFDDLSGYLEEKGSYSREVDDAGNPTEKIADKETYHLMDAERYIIGGYLKGAKLAAQAAYIEIGDDSPFEVWGQQW